MDWTHIIRCIKLHEEALTARRAHTIESEYTLRGLHTFIKSFFFEFYYLFIRYWMACVNRRVRYNCNMNKNPLCDRDAIHIRHQAHSSSTKNILNINSMKFIGVERAHRDSCHHIRFWCTNQSVMSCRTEDRKPTREGNAFQIKIYSHDEQRALHWITHKSSLVTLRARCESNSNENCFVIVSNWRSKERERLKQTKLCRLALHTPRAMGFTYLRQQ